MADVFVSYASEDRARIRPIVEVIEQAGFTVWWDRRIGIGASFDREIERELEAAACVVVVWSKHSIESDWVRNEAQEGLDRGVLLPILIDDVRPPLAFRRAQAAQLVGQLSEDELGRVVSSIKSIVSGPVRAPRLGDDDRHQQRLSEPSTDLPTSLVRKQGRASANRMRRIPIAVGLAAIFAVLVYWFAVGRLALDAPLTAIAVLPLEDQSPTDHQYLADGLTSSLRDALNRIPSLTISGRTSTRRVNTTNANLETLGDVLGVGSIVDGSVQVVGSDLKVVAEWTQVRDGSQLWSARYERKIRDINDVPGVQNEIAKAIAEAIRLEMGVGESLLSNVHQSRYEPTDVRAWQLMLECESLIYRFSREGFAEAEQFCQRAIEIDPNYAQAYAQLALVYLLRGDLEDPRGNLARAEQAARRAIQLNPNSADANWALAHLSMRQWDLSAADERLERAIQAYPSVPLLALARVVLRWRQGKPDEALAEARRAVLLEPMWVSAQSFLGMSHLALGDHEAALTALQTAATLGGMDGPAKVSLAIAYEMDGQSDKALDTILAALPDFEEEIRLGYEANGWKGIGHALAEEAPIDSCPAEWHALAGEVDEMYECLEISLVSRAPELPESLHASAVFSPYRHEERFQDLVERVRAQIR